MVWEYVLCGSLNGVGGNTANPLTPACVFAGYEC